MGRRVPRARTQQRGTRRVAPASMPNHAIGFAQHAVLCMAATGSATQPRAWRSFAHLADDVLVREPDDQAVLGRVVLVLVLRHQAQARAVVRLPLSPPLVLDLRGGQRGSRQAVLNFQLQGPDVVCRVRDATTGSSATPAGMARWPGMGGAGGLERLTAVAFAVSEFEPGRGQ